MTFTELYHVGIVVADLDAAVAEFEDILGIHWASPQQHNLKVWTPAGTVRSEFRFTYSKPTSGTPLIELIEAPPGTPWWQGEGVTSVIHHVGFWADPLGPKAAELEAAGAPIEAALMDRDGSPRLFTYHQLKHGPRIELVDTARRESMMAWINGDGT